MLVGRARNVSHAPLAEWRHFAPPARIPARTQGHAHWSRIVRRPLFAAARPTRKDLRETGLLRLSAASAVPPHALTHALNTGTHTLSHGLPVQRQKSEHVHNR